MAGSLKIMVRQWLLQVLGWLGLRAFLWRLYCRCFGPGGGILRLELGKHQARFYVNSKWVLDDLKAFGGEQEVLTLLISKLEPGDVVYDIGADLGLHTVFLSKAVGERGLTVAFEPDDHHRERLRANVALNGLSNVRIIPVALGDRSHTSEMVPSVRGTAASRVAEVRPETIRAGTVRQKVRVVAGDELVEQERLPLPRLVKIDVEGYEYAVAQGLKRTLSNPVCEFLCCEIHPKLLPDGISADHVWELFKGCGFVRFDFLSRRGEQHVLASKSEGDAPRS